MSMRRVFALLLAVAALGALPATSADAQVTVVGCTGTPTTDGTNLRNAYNAATGSATAPAVVVPSPCLYDLGTTTLTLKNFVDLIGYGRNDAIITSQVDRGTAPNSGTITVPSGVDAEIANLTVRNDSVDCYGIRNASSAFVLEDVIVEATCEEDAVAIYTVGRLRGIDLVLRANVDGEEVVVARAVGLEDDGGGSVVSDTLITATGVACTDAFGAIYDGADGTLDDTSIFVDCQDAVGVAVSGGSDPRINDSKIFLDGSNGDIVGIDVSGTSTNVVRVDDTRIEGDDSTNAYGVRNSGANSSILLADAVVLIGSNATTSVGAQVDAGLLTADRSTLSGSSNSFVVATGATGRFGASKLSGTRGTAGTTACAASYTGAYAAIPPATC